MPSIFPAVEARSIGELATKLELDPAALEKTVAEFNAAVRRAHSITPCSTIARPKAWPFRKAIGRAKSTSRLITAYPLRPGITFTYLGVRVNEEARMLLADGRPSGNMFAAGEIMAGNVLGKGYLAGIGMTIGAVFGRLAGEGAAKNARN